MAALEQSRDEIFTSFADNMQLVLTKLKETVFKAMSFEATKLAACFTSPPPPSAQECQSLLSSVEMKTITLVSFYYSLPKECGLALRKHTRNLVIDLVEGIKELSLRIKSANYQGSEEQLQSTGAVWASCDTIQTAAKNNKDATLKELKAVGGLVKDAVEELNEAKNSDGSSAGGLDELEFLLSGGQQPTDHEDDAVWSDQDRAVVHPCLGLANACKACVKKVSEAIKKNGKHEEMVHISQLDHIYELSEEISPNLDELVSCLYAPMRYAVVRANASLVSEVLHKILGASRESHFVRDEDSQWLDFLEKAVDHNVDQIKNITKSGAQR
ncbi:cyclin-D1-binding protein 1 homolog isoform X1 [Diadema setosum]|uniref:cyclin-D1-binding protein 1 homolog isoform X1 n=1 Tax=Diadema setosum TaxID=31175 RepID=UPI003B3BCE39